MSQKIIFIHLLNDYSGSPKVLSQVLKVAEENSIDVELFTGNKTEGFLTDLTKKHSFFIYKRFENRYLTLVSFLFSQAVLFFKLLRYWNKDVSFYINTMLPFGAGLAGWFMRKPVIYHIHEISLSPILLKHFLKKVIQLSAQKVVYVSHAVKVSEPFKSKQSFVIHNALPAGFGPKQNDLAPKIIDDKFHVLMIASLKVYKGLYEFLKIADKLAKDSSIYFDLVLNAEQDEIEFFFKDMTIPHNVNLVPRQKNVLAFYKNANLLLNLSRIDEWVETFGLTIIEAMAFGIPVIVPPVGGPAEIVKDGKEGYLISSYDVDEIAHKIKVLLQDRIKYLELSKNAYLRSFDFTVKEFNNNTLKMIYA